MSCHDCDARYDVVLRDKRCDGVVTEELPLMLVEQGGLGYSVSLTSPFGGKLSQGDLQNAELADATVRTQRDWRGGRNFDFSFGSTDQFSDGVADTRFYGAEGVVVLPPKVQTATQPSSLPSDYLFSRKGMLPMLEYPADAFGATQGLRVPFWVWEDDLRRWNGSTWVLVKTFASTVWSVVEFARVLYITRSSGADSLLEKSTDYGATWTGVKTFTNMAQVILCAYNGYLHACSKDGLYDYSADAVTWLAAAIQVSIPLGAEVNGLVGYSNDIIISTNYGLWTVFADIPKKLLDYDEFRTKYTGLNPEVWPATNALYIPIKDGLYAWSGQGLTAVGPDAAGGGLPDLHASQVICIFPTERWLYILTRRANTTGTYGDEIDYICGLYAMDTGGRWHELAEFPYDDGGTQGVIRAGFDVTQGCARLWIERVGALHYVNLPRLVGELSETPYEFADAGQVVSSWIGSELRHIPKEVQAVLIKAEIPTNTAVSVELEVDGSGVFTSVGSITQVPYQEIELCAPNRNNMTVGASSTTSTINVASTTGWGAGDFVRIGAEVQQVKAVVSGTQFTTVLPFRCAPESGAVCYPSRPVGREFRYRLNLTTSDDTKTPKVFSVALKYQDQVIDRARVSLQVKCESGMRDRENGVYPIGKAADLRSKLDVWTRRLTPFEVQLPDGRVLTMKCINNNQSIHKRTGVECDINSTVVLNLIEVAEGCGV